MTEVADDPPSGLVVVDKGAGWTSHDVVARVRRIFGLRRVGHAGTLDPDATGVLLVGVGRTTRLLRYLTALPKTYRTEIVLGTATDTLDAAGTVTDTWSMEHVTADAVRRAALDLTGAIEQIPPMVSAVKVDGKRLHVLARQGKVVERSPRPVTVMRFDIDPTDTPSVYVAEVECSSGTYVRVLAADLGTALGGGAHLRALRRTSIGSFSLTDAIPLDDLTTDALLPPVTAVRHLSPITVDEETETLVGRGLPLDRVSLGAAEDGPWAVRSTDGRLLAVYEATESDRIRPAVVLSSR